MSEQSSKAKIQELSGMIGGLEKFAVDLQIMATDEDFYQRRLYAAQQAVEKANAELAAIIDGKANAAKKLADVQTRIAQLRRELFQAKNAKKLAELEKLQRELAGVSPDELAKMSEQEQ